MIRRAGGVVVDRQGYDWMPTRHDGFCLASRSLRVAEGLLELLGEDV